MSLLFQNSNEKVNKLASEVYNKHFELDPMLNNEYNDRQKRLMYNDILYNLGYLETAMEFNDDKIFIDYSVWIYQLLCHLIKSLDRVRLKEQMVMHYEILKESLSAILSEEEASKACHHLNNAIEATVNESINLKVSKPFESEMHLDIKKEYLRLLLRSDTTGAYRVIEKAADSGVQLDEIYLKIIQEVMYEIGNLWHQNVIKVDKEHYCTATTQMVLSQFYPLIFSQVKNDRKILACAVGNELHEMGIRMVSDLFEYHGWDSIYLGAAVPIEAILNSIKEHRPDLVALSVTMPQHLSLCYEIVKAIRKENKHIKIAVGGQAFQSTDELWKKWDVDISTENAVQLIDWANKNILIKKDNKR